MDRKHRSNFKYPTSKYASLCAAHLEDDCYEHKLSVTDTIGQSERLKIRGYIKRTVVPKRDTVVPAGLEVPSG